MSLRVILERYAEEDFTGRADHIARDHPAVVLAFIDAVERTFARLADMPEIGSPSAFPSSAAVAVAVRGPSRQLPEGCSRKRREK